MKGNTRFFLMFFLWLICAFHVVVGVGLNVAPEMPRLMADLYGATVNWTAELSYIIKPLGAFMFALGVLAAAAALNPTKYRIVIYAFALLFVVRAAQRLVFAAEINETFGIATGRNIGNVVFFLAMAAVIVVLDLVSQKKPAQ